MESTQYMEIRDIVIVEDEELNSQKSSNTSNRLQLPRLKHYKRLFRVFLYINFLLVGQSAATLLVRLYYNNGGNSKWIVTFVQSAGFPIWIPVLFFWPRSTNPTLINNSSNSDNSPRQPCAWGVNMLLFIFFGINLVADNLMYSYGLLYLPVSTYSLICASQLAFIAVFSFLINSQKISALIFNSIFLLTLSASLLAVHPDSEGSTKVSSQGKYTIGFLCTLGASALYSLGLSLLELSFKKVFKRETFEAVLDMQIYPSFVATCACVVGLFASGEWKNLPNEMQGYKKGRASYIMTLFWIAISWQMSSLGLFGLIFEVSSLFSNVISTILLPVLPILGVIFFHDKVDAVKVIALLLAVWAFLSYIYQHYLDGANSRKSVQNEEASA